jgi:hypothetical protein
MFEIPNALDDRALPRALSTVRAFNEELHQLSKLCKKRGRLKSNSSRDHPTSVKLLHAAW